MDFGMIGLGRMGANMVRRLTRAGLKVAVYDRDPNAAPDLAPKVARAGSLKELVTSLAAPRKIWLMLPAGDVTEQTLAELHPLLAPGDIIVDGGNANYKDSVRRAAQAAEKRLTHLDVGVSGGIWGLENGYALMIGGDADASRALEPYFKALAPAPDAGWLHCGPAGSGHFVKMIHNGIEYGMMQAYAEGLALLKGKTEFDIDLAKVTEMWRHGSVVRSWLLDLTADFLRQDQTLAAVAPVVADSGEGRWTALEAIEQGVPAPVMSLALMMRFASQGKDDYPAKLLAMMRLGFGGHALQKKS